MAHLSTAPRIVNSGLLAKMLAIHGAVLRQRTDHVIIMTVGKVAAENRNRS